MNWSDSRGCVCDVVDWLHTHTLINGQLIYLVGCTQTIVIIASGNNRMLIYSLSYHLLTCIFAQKLLAITTINNNYSNTVLTNCCANVFDILLISYVGLWLCLYCYRNELFSDILLSTSMCIIAIKIWKLKLDFYWIKFWRVWVWLHLFVLSWRQKDWDVIFF